jgi:hypothetical protein
MIRILVLALAAANLLYLGWSHWLQEEQPRLVTPAPAAPRAPAPPSSTANAAPPPCTTLGPIGDETRALEIEQILRDLQLSPARRSITEDVHEGWWVSLASPNAATQARTLKTIQNAGISDAFAMPDDPQFRVSVGLFQEEERATSRAESLRALKLDPMVSERVETRTSFWFDLPGAARAAVNLAQLEAEGLDVQALRTEECPVGEDVSIDAIIPQEPAEPGEAPRV